MDVGWAAKLINAEIKQGSVLGPLFFFLYKQHLRHPPEHYLFIHG